LTKLFFMRHFLIRQNPLSRNRRVGILLRMHFYGNNFCVKILTIFIVEHLTIHSMDFDE
jgi:hypothetical protein